MIFSSLISSTADYGTRSISASYRELLKPTSEYECGQGFRRMGVSGWISAAKFIRGVQAGTLVCLFNAPTLLGAAFRRSKGVRSVAILDWTESYPSLRRKPWTPLYDWIYIQAFRRLDAIYSPSAGFRNYYNGRGASIKPCLYPLPNQIPQCRPFNDSGAIRVLYIGADYRRKGGDVLLKFWAERRPRGAALTFVCPTPPECDVEGVRFLRQVKAGTDEQRSLFLDHDLFVLPTREEPFGFALLEAINAGMFTITTSAAGAADVVAEAGGVVAPNPETAIETTLQMVGNPSYIFRRQEMCLEFLPKYSEAVRRSIEEICFY